MPRIAYLFAGPQAASMQMGRDLYNKVLSVRNSMDKADKVFAAEGFKVTKACFLGTPEDLQKPSISAPAMLAICHGIGEALKSKRVSPQMCAGYGWGEISALACSGALPYEEALLYLRRRGEILEAAWAKQPFHVCAVTGLGALELAKKFEPLQHKPEIIADDSPDACVVAGAESLLKKIMPLLASKSVKVSAVAPGPAWPHPSLKEAGLQVADAFSKLNLERHVPVDFYSALLPGRLADFRDLAAMQARLCYEPIRWRELAAALREGRMDTLVEIGPGSSLGGFARKLDAGIRALATEDTKSLSSALKLAI